MIFSSFTFLWFFAVFFILYWFILNKSIKLQNLFLLAGSYVFYGWADWRFLFLLFGISLLNFFIASYIEKTTNPLYRKLLLSVGIVQGIGGLIFFKYFNFFIISFKTIFTSLHINISLHTLNIIIPLGISFFTFRILNYLFDVNRGKIKPTTDLVIFLNYVAFFPSLLAGPIDRAKTFIPQLENKRVFNYSEATNGMRQILWGLFKKIVIADGCAMITSPIFDNYQNLPGSTLLLGALFYTIQIYADFSGYSDMAIGIARLLGFTITKNFDFPFFAQNIAEFWRKWHMSLTSWFTDYVFTPLSITFRDWGKTGLILAILINFTIVGIWHGANWTYILFGFLHGCYFIPLILKGTMNKKKKIAKDKLLPSFREAINIIMTFALVVFTFVIFRAENISQAIDYYQRLFSGFLISIPEIPSGRSDALITFSLIIGMLFIEWLQREKDHGLEIGNIKSPALRLTIYYLLIFIIILFGATNSNQFIYFKF